MNKRKFITVEVTKTTYAKDGYIYITVHHPLAKNYPTFFFETNKFTQFESELEKYDI